MKALIVDDEPLARNELQYLLNLNDAIDEIEEAENIEETLEKLLYNTFDLIFLDINLMDESGIDLAQKINIMKRSPHIIFATAHEKFAVKAFELNATDYILKPFEKERINQAVNKVDMAKDKPKNKDKTITPKYIDYSDDERAQTHVLPIEVDERIHILNFTDIIALSVNNGITTIDTTKQSYETTETLNHYEKKLPSSLFIKIHRATIVNKEHIQTIEHWFNYTYQLTLTHEFKYQVSRSYMKTFKQQLGLQ